MTTPDPRRRHRSPRSAHPKGVTVTTADPAASLAQLHRQVAALLAVIDTAILPAPTRVHRRKDRFQGREWAAAPGWLVYALDTPDDTGFVYVDHACEDYRWGEPGDWEALRVEEARRIGLALLAAAHHAEQIRTVTPLTTTTEGDNKEMP